MTSKSIDDCLKSGRAFLTQHAIAEPLREARLLLSFVIDRPIEFIIAYGEVSVSKEHYGQFEAVLERRGQGEPSSKIMGQREFWSRLFYVNQDVLDPRPDSETLIDAIEDYWGSLQNPKTVLDLGLGSGCLLLTTLLNHPELKGFGVDKSWQALMCARRNVSRHTLESRVHLINGDWVSSLKGQFDIIISNPPYIASADLPLLSPELKYDPAMALDGGVDGLIYYRLLADQLGGVCASHTLVFFEIGMGQANDVQNIMMDAGFLCLEWRCDLAGLERVGVFRLK
jgi:release factor glutamine methyltransferase